MSVFFRVYGNLVLQNVLEIPFVFFFRGITKIPKSVKEIAKTRYATDTTRLAFRDLDLDLQKRSFYFKILL